MGIKFTRNIILGVFKYFCCRGVLIVAQNYGGWQFGVWASQLGDGRAVSVFEGGSKVRYEVQLKGSGKTPYSRFA